MQVEILDGEDPYNTNRRVIKQWVPLKDLKASHPVECAEYAVASKIDHHPPFIWWVNRTLKRPMFRIGGSAGTGITSGLDQPQKMANGGRMGFAMGNTELIFSL